METRSHLLLVSVVVAAVFAALIAFIMWISPNRGGDGRRYDILFEQSVSGLLVGSPVSFAGIPVGRVESIELAAGAPGRVRVRVNITDKALTIQEGTIAELSGNLLFGTSLISLENSKGGGKPILAQGDAIPVIPARGPGFGDLANDPTPLINSISLATDRLLAATSPEGQRRISTQVEALRTSTAAAAAEAPAVAGRISQARLALGAATSSASDFASRADAMERRLNGEGRAKVRDLRASVASSRQSLRQLDDRLNASRPALQGLNRSTADLNKQIEGLRTSVGATTEAVEQVERGGAGALLSEPTLPDYKPKG